MPIDLSKVQIGGTAPGILHPRDLFTALPSKDPKYQYPRDVQTQVWDSWFVRRDEHDLVIKMNTGAGKTVVGLMICQSSLVEGASPVVYVAPDIYLTGQVIAEARALGLEVTDDPSSARFLAGQAILVVNIYKLFNGKSVFGVGSPRLEVGTFVIDDAHACLGIAEQQFSIVVEAPSAAYDKLWAVFRADLKHQSQTTVLDVEAHDPGKAMLVPFWAWQSKQDAVVGILHECRDEEWLRFAWPLLREILPLCSCVIGSGRIEITPRCLPVDEIPAFTQARRRVFMSATIADDSVLVTHFAVSPEAARAPVVPRTASDIGDRLILMPQALDPTIDDDSLKAFAYQTSIAHNVVVLVPSNARAAHWVDVAAEVLTAENLAVGVERLRAGHVGLVVVVNKYDGVDLPDEACRLLIVDGIPEYRRGIDRIEESALAGSPEQVARAVQRIEQGMGRGVRSSEDRCAVLLIGRSLARLLFKPTATQNFTPATRAQYELSASIGEQIRNNGINALQDAVGLVLQRDAGWVGLSRKAVLAAPVSSTGTVSELAVRQRAWQEKAILGDYDGAEAELRASIDLADGNRVRGWLKMQLAATVNFRDEGNAQTILQSAQNQNRGVLRPLAGITYTRLSPGVGDQAHAAARFAAESFNDSNALLVELHAVLEDLTYRAGSAREFEEAVRWLGEFLGFPSQRPEHESGHGPDGLWSLGDLKYVVSECKSGVVNGIISKSDANQIAGSLNWFTDNYDTTCTATGVLWHPATILHGQANVGQTVRVIDVGRLVRLKDQVQKFGTALASGAWPPEPERVAASLSAHGLTGQLFIDRFTTTARRPQK